MSNVSDIIAHGLSVQRQRVNTIASNLANAETTRTAEGGPYKRKDVVVVAQDLPHSSFESTLDEMSLSRPRVLAVVEDQSEPRKVFQPGHPDADKEGYVAYPNVNVVSSMTDLMSASRAYEAQLSVLKTVRAMVENALTLGRL